jgi:ferritin-like metal-binding protein YciE
MSETATKGALLQACVQDLYAARQVAMERQPCVTRKAGPELTVLLEELTANLAEEAERFESTDISLEGPENLWMAGVMDDAERDTRSIARGALLDTALIGAVRKGVAADAVSLETAIAVARSLGREDIAALVEAMRARSSRHDGSLRAMLDKIA